MSPEENDVPHETNGDKEPCGHRERPSAGHEAAAPPPIPGRWLARTVSAVVTAIGSVGATWPLILHMGNATLRKDDVWLSAWQLNAYQEALLSDPLRWADANIFFPYDGAAAVNDLLWSHALLTLPAAWAGSAVIAHNVAFLGGIVLCAVFAHLLIEELTGSRWAAVLGGMLFALTPFRFLHAVHLSVAAAWSLPLFFWAQLRHFREPSWGRAAIASVAGMSVAMSSLYYPLFLAPVLPFVLWFAARRGPGGRRAWLPLAAAGTAGLALLAPLLLPFATALRSYGVPAARSDLTRFAAELSSLAQRPLYMRDGVPTDLHPEALLYPGASLLLFGLAGLTVAAAALVRSEGWLRWPGIGLPVLLLVSLLGLLVPLAGLARSAWAAIVVLTVWAVPLLLAAWAIHESRPAAVARGLAGAKTQRAFGGRAAIRFGLAGAALSFAFALGPQVRHAGEYLGPAPYSLLTRLTSIYEGTRVPARFAGLVVLFLAVVAAGVVALIQRRGVVSGADGVPISRPGDAARGAVGTGRDRLAAAVIVVALIVTFAELPRGYDLAPVPPLDDPTYAWLREQPERFGVLELPEHRGDWGALRYMLASKQHGQHLANGVGRITPGLWHQFLDIEPWSEEFFVFIESYLPVRYVIVHGDGLPDEIRVPVMRRLLAGVHGWREEFRAGRTRVFSLDRSAGGGEYIDRIYLRAELSPGAIVRFAARIAPAADQTADERSTTGGAGARAAGGTVTLGLFQNAEPVASFEIGDEWRDYEVFVPVAPIGPLVQDSWPRSGTLLTWQMDVEGGPAFEVRNLSVIRVADPPLDASETP